MSWRNYQHKLNEYDALDFDDLLVKTVELLGVEEVQASYYKEISYILVDEFHDVNSVQYQSAPAALRATETEFDGCR